MSRKKIRYAVVGLGHIAQVAILPAFRNAKRSELTALVSGDLDKLTLLGKKYGVRELFTYAQYDELLKSGLIDAVYIALPNHLHKEYTVRAAQAGIHVLCEKPMAITVQDCEEMIATCDENHVKLMIAYRLHFEPTHLTAIRLIHEQKKLGDPRIFQSMHSQATNFPNIRTYPISMGGGPTYDLGIYDINAARYIFQDEPTSVFAQCANVGKAPYREIEESMAVILRFPKERLASLIYSFGTVSTDFFRVAGTRGELGIEPAYTYIDNKILRYTVSGRSKTRTKERCFEAHDEFGPEIDYFSGCILDNRKIEPSGREGLADIRIIEAIYQSASTGEMVELPPFKKSRRPTSRQEIERPSFELPQPYRAEPPSKKIAA